MRCRFVTFSLPPVSYPYPITSSTKKSNFSQVKKRKFLEEDFKWMQHNDEEVISLMSQTQEADNFLSETTKKIKDGFYPLIFLAVFAFTNLIPPFVGCLRETNSLQCMMFNNKDSKIPNEVAYQVGNIVCALLSVCIFWQIYKLQKVNLTNESSKNLNKYSTLNFVFGVLSSVLWMSYVKLSEFSSKNLVSEITLDLYLIVFLFYNLFNQICLKSRVETSGECGNCAGWKKMLLFLFKNAYFFMMMAMLLIIISLQISVAIVSRYYSESVALPILTNYIEIAQTLATISNQFFVSLYYIDMNYVYDGDLLYEEKRKIKEKKYGMSML